MGFHVVECLAVTGGLEPVAPLLSPSRQVLSMKFSVAYPTTEVAGDPDAISPHPVLARLKPARASSIIWEYSVATRKIMTVAKHTEPPALVVGTDAERTARRAEAHGITQAFTDLS